MLIFDIDIDIDIDIDSNSVSESIVILIDILKYKLTQAELLENVK